MYSQFSPLFLLTPDADVKRGVFPSLVGNHLFQSPVARVELRCRLVGNKDDLVFFIQNFIDGSRQRVQPT